MSARDQQVAGARKAYESCVMELFKRLYANKYVGDEHFADKDKALDALLTTHRRQVLAEIEEKLRKKANASDGRAVRLTAHMGYMWSADFVASLQDTKEGT